MRASLNEVLLDVRNASGLHARPAAQFVRAASEFNSQIRITNLTRDAERSANAKSLLGILGLGVSPGHRIRITADGDDAEAAVERLARLVESGMGDTSGR